MRISAAVDTVIIAAIVDSKDKWHGKAIQLFEALTHNDVDVVVFDPVVNEVISVVARRLNEQGRADQTHHVLERSYELIPDDTITWISSETRRLYPQIVETVAQHNGLLNFHDALISLACRENGIGHIASFDKDFDRVEWLIRISSPEDLPLTA